MGNPTYMYRLKDGEVEAKIFDSDDLPKGWHDAPPKEHTVFDIEKCDSKDDLEKYAKKVYGVDIDKRRSLVALKNQVKALGNGE